MGLAWVFSSYSIKYHQMLCRCQQIFCQVSVNKYPQPWRLVPATFTREMAANSEKSIGSGVSFGSSYDSKEKSKRRMKISAVGSPSEQLLKIMENPQRAAMVYEVSEQLHMNHYVIFIEKITMLYDISENQMSPYLIGLVKDIANGINHDYIVTDGPEQLGLPESIRKEASTAIVEYLAKLKPDHKEELDFSFLGAIQEEALKVMAAQFLPRYQQRKPTNILLGSLNNTDKIDEKGIENLVAILDHPEKKLRLLSILAKQLCLENYYFYQQQKEIQLYAASATSPVQQQAIKKMLKQLGRDFVAPSSIHELNIPSKIRADFEESCKNSNLSITHLTPVTKEVLNMVLRNSLPLYYSLKW